VKHGNGEFTRCPTEHFKTLDDNLILLPPVKLKVKSLCDEIPLIWRKDQALTEIMETKKFPQDMVESFHRNFEGALNQLKTEAKVTLDEIDKDIAQCDKQIKDLNSALVNLEIERGIGRIDDKSYQTSMLIIQEGLKQTTAEKSDLLAMRNTLSNMLLGDKPLIETETKKESVSVSSSASASSSSAISSALQTTLPEPPVVVHVKPVKIS